MFLVIGPKVGLSELGMGPGFMQGTYTKGMLAKAKNGSGLFVDKRWKAAGYKFPKTKEQSPLFK